MSVYDTMTIWNEEREEYVSSRKAGKPMGRYGPHYPNKAERVLLTQMMQKSGQTEEQVRADVNNRRRLAEAAKSTTHPSPVRSRASRLALIARRIERQRRKWAASPTGMWLALKG